MLKIFPVLAVLAVILQGTAGYCGSVASDCTYKGISLYGRVQAVKHAADLKVEVVSLAPDLRVEKVGMAANSCGRWEFVDFAPDFTVEFVNMAADIRIEFVNMAPGRP